jgi:hypothetical protein
VVSSYKLPEVGSLSPTQASQVEEAYAQASRDVFISMVPIMGLCLIICVFIKDRGLSRKEPEPAAKAAESAPPQPPTQVQGPGNDMSASDTASAQTDIENGGDHLASRKA